MLRRTRGQSRTFVQIKRIGAGEYTFVLLLPGVGNIMLIRNVKLCTETTSSRTYSVRYSKTMYNLYRVCTYNISPLWAFKNATPFGQDLSGRRVLLQSGTYCYLLLSAIFKYVVAGGTSWCMYYVYAWGVRETIVIQKFISQIPFQRGASNATSVNAFTQSLDYNTALYCTVERNKFRIFFLMFHSREMH